MSTQPITEQPESVQVTATDGTPVTATTHMAPPGTIIISVGPRAAILQPHDAATIGSFLTGVADTSGTPQPPAPPSPTRTA